MSIKLKTDKMDKQKKCFLQCGTHFLAENETELNELTEQMLSEKQVVTQETQALNMQQKELQDQADELEAACKMKDERSMEEKESFEPLREKLLRQIAALELLEDERNLQMTKFIEEFQELQLSFMEQTVERTQRNRELNLQSNIAHQDNMAAQRTLKKDELERDLLNVAEEKIKELKVKCTEMKQELKETTAVCILLMDRERHLRQKLDAALEEKRDIGQRLEEMCRRLESIASDEKTQPGPEAQISTVHWRANDSWDSWDSWDWTDEHC